MERSLHGMKTGTILTLERTAERLEEWARAHGLELSPETIKWAREKIREAKLKLRLSKEQTQGQKPEP